MNTRVKMIMADIFQVDSDNITESSDSENIENWDSVNHIQLIQAIEEEFDIMLTEDEYIDMLSYKKILEFVRGKT